MKYAELMSKAVKSVAAIIGTNGQTILTPLGEQLRKEQEDNALWGEIEQILDRLGLK